MRNLEQLEIDVALDDNGESEECTAIEATIAELASKGTGTFCGHENNYAFGAISKHFEGTRKVRGWYDSKENAMCGMVHIECDDFETAEQMSEIAYEEGGGGSLRPSGKSLWEGFYEFEIE